MLTPGTLLDGRYEIVSLLGSGGMGYVYRARRALLGDDVAIKVMQVPDDAPEQARQRFLREGRACAQLHHPNIVTILDFNVSADRQPYLVMELLTGPSLREELDAAGALPVPRVVEVLAAVASALQTAHDHEITHRDLKPENIVAHRYGSGERLSKVIDFGLAAMTEAFEVTRLTRPDTFLGTLAYAAPEQLRGEPPTARADIYSLGVIAYEMLTGRRPFDDDDNVTLILKTLYDRPLEPGQRRPNLTADADAAIMRALAKSPAERWPSAVEFSRALRAALGAAPSASAATADDSLLARYELGEVLGRGRLGSEVYRATHRALGIPVAIRLLRREGQPHWDAVRGRFLVEARTLQVAHPNLLQVRDFGQDDRRVFVVSDLIVGPSLRMEMARAGAMPWARVAALLAQMLDATAALNAHGGFIVGVNPDMIRLSREADRERVVMSTAGIRSVQDVLATMREQDLRGSEVNQQELPYIAPEVLLGNAPQPPADVFTVGVLAYEMATGHVPFRANSLPELIGRMLQNAPPPAASINPDVPAAASDLLARSLASAVATRIQSARDFLSDLRSSS